MPRRAAGSLGFEALAAAVPGTESVAAILALSPLARATLEDGPVGHETMPSVFATWPRLGGGIGQAWTVQGVVAAVVVGVLLAGFLLPFVARPLGTAPGGPGRAGVRRPAVLGRAAAPVAGGGAGAAGAAG